MTWQEIINQEKDKDYLKKLLIWVNELRQTRTIYPDQKDVFRALTFVPFDKIKVVIVGQDPYHDGNADGLAFSCKKNVSPSLAKIFDSLEITYDPNKPAQLDGWAKQGVLLLNTSLTVEKGFPGSHAEIGWETFTGEIIRQLILDPSPKVFLLWGKSAQSMFDSIYDNMDAVDHIRIFESEHPVAAAYKNREWKGGFDFTLATGALMGFKVEPINWKQYEER